MSWCALCYIARVDVLILAQDGELLRGSFAVCGCTLERSSWIMSIRDRVESGHLERVEMIEAKNTSSTWNQTGNSEVLCTLLLQRS